MSVFNSIYILRGTLLIIWPVLQLVVAWSTCLQFIYRAISQGYIREGNYGYVTDFIYWAVQVLRENLYWIRISTQEAGLIKPVELQDEGQPSHVGSHELRIERTCVLNVPDSVRRIRGNVKTYKLLLWGGVMYLKITVFTVKQFSSSQ